MCGNRGSIVVVVTGCSIVGGGGWPVVLFYFGNVSILISIYFVLLPGNREG